MKNYIKDYDFISNMDALFDKKIIIYGAGYQGKKTAQLLDDIGVDFEGFCDKDENKKHYLDHPVITIDELKQRTEQEDYFIIVGSEQYCEEIIAELQEKQIDAYVCSWYGFRVGIEINILDKRLPKAFAQDFIYRKARWTRINELGNCYADIWKNQMLLCVRPDTVLIYQPSKVGSTTLWKTMLKAGISAIQIHCMVHAHASIYGNWQMECKEQADTGWLETIAGFRKRKQPLKMVVCVREPVGRALSLFMQTFNGPFLRYYNINLGMKENAYKFIERQLTDDYEFTWWFDKELKAVTGIDIYKYPFDKDLGYAWIKEDGIELLLLKMEMMNVNQKVIGEFVGKPGLELANDNVGNKKYYRYIYEQLKKEIQLPDNLIKEQYRNERFKHFYTEEETESFLKKFNV